MGPAIRMNYVHQKYFASHGYSNKAVEYRKLQKKLIEEENLMDAIEMDIADIKSKTGSIYGWALLQMREYAQSLDPKDFIKK